METSKNANRMDTQKTWQLAFLSITHDQEVQIEFYIAIEHNIIYNIYIYFFGTFATWIRTWNSRKSWVECGLMSHADIVWGSLSRWQNPFKPILVGRNVTPKFEVEITIPIKFGEKHLDTITTNSPWDTDLSVASQIPQKGVWFQ